MPDQPPAHQIDFASPAFLANPYPYYDLMRAHAPILYRADWGMWFLSAYEDVNRLLRDRRLGRQITHLLTREQLGWPPIPEAHAPFYRMNDSFLMEKEPPDHTRLKALVLKVFTPRRVEALRPRVQAIADSLLDRIIDGGQMNLLEDFAVPLSVTVIADLLGIPQADRHQMRPWSADIVAMYELGNKEVEAVAGRAVRAVEEFSAYLRQLARQRRQRPGDDLISALAAVEDGGDRLSEDELIANCILLLNAGHEATVNAVGNGMLALFQHPDQMARLKSDPALTATAIEEMLRYDTPLPLFRRWVLEDMDYKGVSLKQGMEVAFLLGAANRDPARFPDPNRFDITRQDNPHLSFGTGIHYCLGAPLARVELQAAINTLLSRLPALHLGTDAIAYHDTFVFRGLKSLPIAW
jgi:cytochrome P450